MGLIKNVLRFTVFLLLLLLIVVVGIEGGWLTPYLFKSPVSYVCESLKGSSCEKLHIDQVRGGLYWGLSVARIDFLWRDKSTRLSVRIPFLKTNFFWKDLIPILKEGKTFSLKVTAFHPLFTVETSDKGVSASLLKGLLIPFTRHSPIPFHQFVKGLPCELHQLRIIDGTVEIPLQGDPVMITHFNVFYERSKESVTGRLKEGYSLKANLQEHEIFFNLVSFGGKKEVFSLVKKVLLGKDMVVNITHEDENKDSLILLYFEDLLLLEGLLEYADNDMFKSYGKITPENIFWKKAKENKVLWRILSEIDPYDYDNTFVLSGDKKGVRLKLSLHEKTGETYFIMNFFLDDSNIVQFDLDFSGLLFAEGEYHLLKERVSAKIVFQDIEFGKVLSIAGLIGEREITGYGAGNIEAEGPIENLTIKGSIETEKGKIDTFTFKSIVLHFSGTGRFIFLEDSKFVRDNGEIPIVGYLDLGINNPLRNIKVKPKNSLVWSGIDLLRDDESFSLEKDLSSRLKVKLLNYFDKGSENTRKDEFGVKIELDLDDMNKFLYKKDEEDSFIGLERTIKF